MLKMFITIGCAVVALNASALAVTMAVSPVRPPVIDGSVTFYPGTAHERQVVGPWFHTVFDVVTDTSVSLNRLSLNVTSSEGETVSFDLPLNGVLVVGGASIKFTDIFGDRLPKSSSYVYRVDAVLFGVTDADGKVFESQFSFTTQ